MSKKKGLSILLAILLLLGIVGCNSNQANNEDASGKGKGSGEKEKVEIRFTWWGDQKRHEIYNAIVDLFEEKYPYIKVKREYGGWADYWNKLSTQIAGGNAPDVVGMHQEYVADYARRGVLVGLDSYIDSGVINLEHFPQSVVNSGKLDGKTVMVAQGVTMSGQVYNTAMFDKLGVKYPDMNWTWEDFKNTAIALTEASKEDGFWGAFDQSRNFTPTFKYFVRQNGHKLFTEDGKLGFDREDAIEWFKMWDELRKKGAIPDAATTAEYYEAPLEQSLFVKGKVGIYGIPANQIYLYQQQFKDGDINMVRQPSQPDGDVGEFIEGAYLSVTKGSKHPKEAAMFIDFFVNTEEALKIFKLEQGSPGSTEMVEVVKPLLEPAQKRTLDYLGETLKIAKTASFPPKGMSEVETAWIKASEAIAFGQVSIEDAVDTFMKEAEAVLGK